MSEHEVTEPYVPQPVEGEVHLQHSAYDVSLRVETMPTARVAWAPEERRSGYDAGLVIPTTPSGRVEWPSDTAPSGGSSGSSSTSPTGEATGSK